MSDVYVERDYEEIAQEAYAEMKNEEEGTPLPEEVKPEEEAEKPPEQVDKDDQETEGEEAKPEEEAEVDSETQDQEEPQEKDLDAKITEHSEKHGMSYAEAKEDLEKINKIVEQFKNDPVEMARAMRNKDREYDKLKNEKVKEESKVFTPLNEDQFRSAVARDLDSNPDKREKILEGYRKRFPAKSEDMSDEAIIEDVVDREYSGYQLHASKQMAKLEQDAKQLRESFVSGLKDEDRQFLPDVKAMLSELSDRDVLMNEGQLDYVLHIAKGRKFDEAIKAAEERALSRAKESPKILGVKESSGQKPTTKSDGPALSQSQKNRAEEMFPSVDGYSADDAYRMFKETFREELKQNPKYV